jgi:hypothetical protein
MAGIEARLLSAAPLEELVDGLAEMSNEIFDERERVGGQDARRAVHASVADAHHDGALMILWRPPMRSRASRLVFGAAAFLALVGAASFIVKSERQIARSKTSLRAFDVHAREASDGLAELRAAQQAYVAQGQDVAFWMTKVTAVLDGVVSKLASLHELPVDGNSRAALDSAAAAVAELGTIARRAREYVTAGQPLMAGDVIFAEGVEGAATAARQIETARQTEQVAFDAAEAAIRRNEALAAGGAAGLAILVILLLLPRPSTTEADAAETPVAAAASTPARTIAPAPAPRVSASATTAMNRQANVLKAAAGLATDFGRVRDVEELSRLLGRAATLMDASGVVVWLGSASGEDLAPTLAHGYNAQALSRMPHVPRSADNAAAAAYRTGQMQIVVARPGAASGAIVAPILSSEGCVGALSAEIVAGSEGAESVQALATIVAAHLATCLGNRSDGAASAQARTG